MMSTTTFDTHGFVKELTETGMPESQAEVLARAHAELINARLVTREYFDLRMAQLEVNLKHDLTQRLASIQIVTVSLIAALLAIGSWL